MDPQAIGYPVSTFWLLAVGEYVGVDWDDPLMLTKLTSPSSNWMIGSFHLMDEKSKYQVIEFLLR